MGSEVVRDITSIFAAIVGLAVLAIIVSRNANTTGVINSSSSLFNTALATAEGPVTGYNVGAPIYASSGTSIGTGVGMVEPGAGYTGGTF